MKKDVVKIIFAVAVLISFGVFCNAQGLGGDFSIEINPENPGPNEKVSAKLVTYSFDANRAAISWILNGEKKLSGVGETKFNFTTDNAGSKITLVVSVKTDNGISVEKTLTFRPADVDLLWEAETYVPPTYKGKAIPTSESRIKVTALPHIVVDGAEVSSSNLIFDWERNFSNVQGASGYGKNSFSFRSAEIFGEDNISVAVSTYSRNITAQSRIRIKMGEPKIIFYKNKPIEGVLYNNALNGEIQLNDSEISVKAEPFFFSKRNMKSLKYEWTMNGEKISSDEAPNIVTLRAEGGTGSANIGLRMSNPINILQFAEKFLRINYGQ